MEGNDKLEQLLGDVLSNTEQATELAKRPGHRRRPTSRDAERPRWRTTHGSLAAAEANDRSPACRDADALSAAPRP